MTELSSIVASEAELNEFYDQLESEHIIPRGLQSTRATNL